MADFVASTPGSTGVIGAAEEIPAILAGESGTRIVGAPISATAAPQPDSGAVLLAVNGTLMRGLKLSPNMAAAGATFVRETRTEPCTDSGRSTTTIRR